MTKTEIQTTRATYQGEPVNLGLIRRELDKYNSLEGSLRVVDEFNRKHRASVSLIRPEVADELLTKRKYLRLLKEYSPFPVGAIVAHEGRAVGSYESKPFSDEISYSDYDVANSISQNVELVTGPFKGKSDSALVIINPTLDDLTIDVMDEAYKRDPVCYNIVKSIKIDCSDERIQQVTDFPSNCGWYKVNGLAIPIGREVEESEEDARYLARFQKPVHHSGSLAWDPVIPYSGTYVGLVFRSALPEEDFYGAGEGIVMAPVDTKGIVVEIPEKDLRKGFEKLTWRKFVDFFR